MSRRGMLWLLLAAALLLCAGCGRRLQGLPADHIVYTEGAFFPEEEESGYATVENEGKVFALYGNIRPRGLLGNLSYAYGDCLGCMEGDESVLLYALAGTDGGVWLIERETVGLMSEPMVLREIHSKGAVPIPDSVVSFRYAYWEE